MTARGPDGAGIWFSEGDRTGLAHRRLSIIDLTDNAAQPMTSADGALTIVFNGEIYNFRALRTELEARGHIFVTNSDTEVLLHLYRDAGDAMVERLRGMFAFALFDARRDRVLLARDPYGIKPLYYADINGCVRFASQVKALLADPAISQNPSPGGLVGFHLLGSVPEPFTIYRDVLALPAGCTLTVDSRGVDEPKRFASVAGALRDAANRECSREAAIDALRDSVRHHLVADVEVGAFLSGGVDSGALVGLMRDCGQERIRACTLQFDEFEGGHNDEVPRARQVAAQYGVDHHVRRVDRTEFEQDLPLIFAAMDQPSIDGINSWFVSKATRELGLKVALSGTGGDELLAGYSTFQSIPRLHHGIGPIARLPGVASVSTALITAMLPRLVERNPKARGVFALAGSWAGSWLLKRAVLLPFELDTVLDPAMASKGLTELRPLSLVEAEIDPNPLSDNGHVAAMEAGLYMKNQLLRDTDWAGMAHSLEVRVPLIDWTLLKAIAPLVSGLKPGEGKALLAQAPSAPLPAEVTDRDKTGFSIPVTAWLKGTTVARPDRRDARGWSRTVIDRYLGVGPIDALRSVA